jgi:DNA-binding CsgD family transcriptional regulator
LKVMCFGLKTKHKNGEIRRILIRYIPLEILNNTKDGISKTAIMTIDDVTHLMKADFYWMRAEFGLNEKQMHHLISTDKKNREQDIVSDREKEVLRLIAEGKDSKEIGEILFISTNTVDNHRRNMIARTGARDTTALAQLCRMGGII